MHVNSFVKGVQTGLKKAFKFIREAFAQSTYPVLNQLDSYHVFQGLNRALGAGQSEYKDGIRKALKEHDFDKFTLWLDTYESTLDPLVQFLPTLSG